MNVDTLSALAEKIIQKKEGSLKDFQSTHLALFKKRGFDSLSEKYKFTPLTRFFETLNLTGVEKREDLKVHLDHSLPTLLFRDGELQNDLTLPGVMISRLSDLNLLGEKDSLSHLHHAFLTDGIVIEIEKKRAASFRILHLHTKPCITAPTVIIKANAFSEVTILEESLGATDSGYSVLSETHLQLQEGSHLEHIQIEKGTRESIHHGATISTVDKDATYRNIVFHVSGKLNRRNLELNLKASGANGESYNLFLTDSTEHSDISTVIHHEAADTFSNQIAKGILDGDSKGVFTGKIHIHPQAQRVASGQLNKNLLLSKKAQVHSQPQLEIFADDVKCSHGSTTGQLSDDEVFYFQARGIPEEKARTLLAHGFGLEIVQKIKDKKAQEFVASLIMDALKTKFKWEATHGPH